MIESKITRIHDKEFIGEKPYEAKVSRTVLKTSQDGDILA